MTTSEEISRVKCDASQVYLLTGKDYRISRSIKVEWFLKQFNTIVSVNADDAIKSSSEELEVLSVLCKGASECLDSCTVVPSTLITFVARVYKFVFCLDISQSLANVDICGKVVTELLFESFKNCIRGLVVPFSVPGSRLVLSPELHVTVLGYTGVTDCGTVQVLIEGCVVSEENVESFLSSVFDKLCYMENKTANVCQTSGAQNSDGEKKHFSNESPIVAMLKMSLLALQLLPGTASSGIVIINDGVFGLPNAAVVHTLLAQLRSHTVCCSFVKVGSPFLPQCSFGYIPNTDLMQFLAVATSGVYLSKAPTIEELSNHMENTTRKEHPAINFYHKAFLCWSFQREYDLSKISSSEEDQRSPGISIDKSITSLEWKKVISEPLRKRKHLERNLKTKISSVLSVRLREGYCIEDITFHRGGKELVVKLLLLWKQNVHIEYTAAASWPVACTNPQTRIEVVVMGTYEFLHDVYSKPLYSMKGYRLNVVETFNHTLKNLEMTDALLVSLQSFSSNHLYYTIPESARRGVPLFYLPPNSPHPVLSLEQGKSRKSSKSQEAQFAVFWKPILSLDVNIWQRWMHCHRINIILEHDRPLPKSLFLPSANDRFFHIQSRMAFSSLATLLKKWSSFVLLENHSYIKFLASDNEDYPYKSFCIARLSSKSPCIVIKLAFLGGMPGMERHEIVNSLRDDIKNITAQFAPPTNLPKQQKMENDEERQTRDHLACSHLLQKPLDRILVRYDEQPKEFVVRPIHSSKSCGIIETFEPWMHRSKGSSESPLKVLSRFLYHQRWVFTLPDQSNLSISPSHIVSKILRCLTRLRENQGFKFVASNLGVTTMFKELFVKENQEANKPSTTCVVQFVIFPPLTSSSTNRVVGWAFDNRQPEDDREMQVVVEVWVEPQQGFVMEGESPEYLVGKQYYEIPTKIFEADLEYISCWLTYDHLRHMCYDYIVSAPMTAVVDINPPPQDPNKTSLIYEVPFPFDIIKVLKRSRQAEILFSTLIESEQLASSRGTNRANDILFDFILENMRRLHDRELQLTDEDSHKFSTFLLSKFEKKELKENVSWSCFTRVENGHLLMTFLPSSYSALLDLVKTLDYLGREPACNLDDRVNQSSVQNGFAENEDFHYDDKTSDGTETFGKFWSCGGNTERGVDLSVFVYDFSVSSLSENDNTAFVNDILLDFRDKFEQIEDAASVDKSKELRSLCEIISELFSWCFVSTVFKCLRRGDYVDDDNLEEVLEVCSDHIPEEIDITDFLENVCSHIERDHVETGRDDEIPAHEHSHSDQNNQDYLKINDIMKSDLSKRCEKLDGLHDFIKTRFSELLARHFAPIPNKKDYYFFRPYFLRDYLKSEESDTVNDCFYSDSNSDIVFDHGEQETDGEFDDAVNITGGKALLSDSIFDKSEDEYLDYPSDRSDMQSSTKDENIFNELRDLEQEYDLPLFLNLRCTIRDRSHLSSTMISMPAGYLPACLGDLLEQAQRDPEQTLDPSITSLRVTLDLICLVPPREPDYDHLKSRSQYRTRSSSFSSLSSISDSPRETMVRFDEETGEHKSVSISASHDRDSSFHASGLPCLQIESIDAIKSDINWLLRDEIVFSLCHAANITSDMLENVTDHIRKSKKLELISSCFTSMRLDFVLDAEKSLAEFVKELDDVSVGGYKLVRLDDYFYLRISSPSNDGKNVDATDGNTEYSGNKIDFDHELFDLSSLFNDGSQSDDKARSSIPDNFYEMWLILKKTASDLLDVFFHTRENHYEKYYHLYTETTSTVKEICHLVNQKLLLRYVYETRTCHPLLQPRSDEDIWNENWTYSASPYSVLDERDGNKVVHTEYRYQPGYFKCPIRWTKNFPIHFRLKNNKAKESSARIAIKALQPVLEKFSLNEKTNMYVYQDKQGDIFYFSLNESLCVNKEAAVGGQDNSEDAPEDSFVSQPLSRASSCLSVSKSGTADMDEDWEKLSRKRSGGVGTDKDTASLNDSVMDPTIREHVGQCVSLSVHGVVEPSAEIKRDLVSVFQKRLDDFTLEMLTMLLARNPNTKLTMQDVQFIQPRDSKPVKFILHVLPKFAYQNLHPFSFFLKQHLLQYLNAPRYTTRTDMYHFRKYTPYDGYTEALNENDILLFSKQFTPGSKGLACMSIDITDRQGKPLKIVPHLGHNGPPVQLQKFNTDEFTRIVEEETSECLPEYETFLVKFFIWERGDIGLVHLKERLKKSVWHALCDVMIEYDCLKASFSKIPEHLMKTVVTCENARDSDRQPPITLAIPNIQIDIGGVWSKPKTKLSHRRTPSAGSLGCGHKTRQAPSPFSRPAISQPVSPVCFAPTKIDVTSQTMELSVVLDNPDNKIETPNAQSRSSTECKLASPIELDKKVRSKSESSKIPSRTFIPITRTLSESQDPRVDVEENKNVGTDRLSPFETFTENELTESKEFGDEALRANNGFAPDVIYKTSRHSELDSARSNEELKIERTKYENGEKGQLHPSFEGPSQQLLQFASSLETPSVNVLKGTLLTRYSVDAVLYELNGIIRNLFPDLTTKIYRAVPKNVGSYGSLLISRTCHYLLYDPIRPPIQANDENESSVDKSGSYMVSSSTHPSSFLLISRNVSQWRSNTLRSQGLKYSEHEESKSSSSRVFYSTQQFQSWDCDCDNDLNDSKSTSLPFSNCSPGFVSRQRLILISIQDKEVIATAYNLSSDINTQFSTRFTKLLNWSNARCHLVSCLFQQKMGLFHHSSLQDLNKDKKEHNQFCETVDDHHLFSLLKQTGPTLSEKQGGAKKQIPAVGKLLFEETLRDVVPPKPLQNTKHCSYRDPVKRHGAQFQEIRGIQIRKAIQNAELHKLFSSWLVDGPFNIVTGDNSISLLKRQSRLLHWVKTPFLASEEWMTSSQKTLNMKIIDNQDDTKNITQGSAEEIKEDEWHYKLREEFIKYYTQYLESHGFTRVQSSVAEPVKISKSVKKPIRKRGMSDISKSAKSEKKSEKPLHYYLQRTIDGKKDQESYAYDGGIMLMELGFEGCHFYVKLYAFESCRLLASGSEKTQKKFLAECSKVGDLTHLNSFSYDFHLRHVQFCLFGQRLVFPKGFRLTSMLSKLMKFYIYPPKFSWNHICRGVLNVNKRRLPCSAVYAYIVEHASNYGMTTIEMFEKGKDKEQVLVSSTSQKNLYDVSLLAKLHHNCEVGVFGLKFFVVMTHRRELFPKMRPEHILHKQSIGVVADATAGRNIRHATPSSTTQTDLQHTLENFKRSSSSPQMATNQGIHPVESHSENVVKPIGLGSLSSLYRFGSPSYTTSNNTERPYIIAGLESDPSDSLMFWDMRTLASEADRCYNKLSSIVDMAQRQSTRDHLWYLLLKGTNNDDTDPESSTKLKGLRRKTEYRRTLSDFTDSWPVPSSLKNIADSKDQMSCDDFEDLIHLVKPVPLPTVDDALKPFLGMDSGWYLGLWSTFSSKFADRTREFTRNDGRRQYLVLLNPKCLDIFLYINIDDEKRSANAMIAHRTVAENNKKSTRVVPKSCEDFIHEVVNVLCYQMWSSLFQI